MPTTSGSSSHPPITLKEKVEFLKQTGSYPDRPAGVETIETHMAFVFLTDRFAYKLKKPVRLDFLDFSTLEARRRNCEAEVLLNRRLAPDLYIGMIPLTVNLQRELQLGEEEEVVDWLVKMHRLPGERMLDYVIRHDTVREEDIRRVASVLSSFYTSSPPVDLSPTEYRQRFERNIHDNLRKLVRPAFGLPLGLPGSIATAQLTFLKRCPDVFDHRVKRRKILEGHGDLRPEHICLLEPKPVIFDCLEFNRTFRILDPADELAFLSLECEHLGAPFIGPLLFTTYGALTGDHPPEALVRFYTSFRALLRAKLAILHLRDAPGDRAKWHSRTLEYLSLAMDYLPV